MKKIDIFLLIFLPILAVILSLFYRANFFLSILLFFGLPSLWLSYRTPKKVKKTLVFASVFIPLSILIDYIAISNGSWAVPNTVFPFRLFGLIPLEDLFFGFFLVYNVVIFYGHFLDKGKRDLTNKKMRYLLWLVLLASLGFFLLVFIRPELLIIKYAYLWMGLVLMLLPSVIFLYFFPKLLAKYVKTASYFFLVFMLFEFTGLTLNQWLFQGTNFIGWVELLGYRFPFEEFFFWFVMSAIAILSYFEFFDDDRR